MADSTDRRLVDIGRRDLMIAGTGAALIAAGIDSLRTAQAQAGPSPTSPPTATAGAAAPGTIEVERRGSMLLVGLNRPQAENRLDPAMLIGLGKAWYRLEHDPDLRVAVLYAIGPDFCRSLDVPAGASAAAAGTYPPKDTDFLHPLNARPPFRTKPIVVAVQGRTGEVGHELFLAADVRVAASDTRFRQAEVAYGAFPGGGATVRFSREAGWANAMRYMLTGDEWSAEDAYRMGLVQEVTPPGKQLDRAIELAAKIADASPRGVSRHARLGASSDQQRRARADRAVAGVPAHHPKRRCQRGPTRATGGPQAAVSRRVDVPMPALPARMATYNKSRAIRQIKSIL
jgi:enoyl-CoA hydratase